ncbi:MAG: PRC and DUF2382 domain-containing protein [Bacteroidota bacterium]|nr:PRC and DUF2382 domain-containing protein [Bacteroidota bacterium]
MTNDTITGNRLQQLKGSDYEIVPNEPDIRGWDVRNDTTTHIGKIEDLIFDSQARKVRYMVVKVDKEYNKESNRSVLVPIGLAKLERIDEDAFLPGITTEQLAALPKYDGTVTTEMENSIRNVLAGVGGAAVINEVSNNRDEFYDHDHFKEDNLYNRTTEGQTTIPVIEENLNIEKKTVETGGAYIRSRIIEQPIEQTIQLQEEHVKVERTQVDKPVGKTDLDTFKEGIIELKEYAEVPVVSKEARVVEEVIISKEVNERNETVRDTVRKTEVDVENIEGSNNSTTKKGMKDQD